MRDELKSLQRRLGKTAIYVTHDQTEALALSDRIAVLSHGKIEQIGTPGDIYERPATIFVAEFIGSSNLLAARIVVGGAGGDIGRAIVETDAGHRFHCALDGEENNSAGGCAQVSVLIRPERIGVRAAGTGSGSEPNAFPAQIREVTYLGEDLHLSLDIGGGQTVRAALKNTGAARAFAVAQPVEVVVDPADLRLLRR